MRLLHLTLALALVAACSALDALPHHARGGSAWRGRQASGRVMLQDNPKPLLFKQKVDHFGKSSDMFQQRYYIDTTFWSPRSSRPVVFLYICGEAPCTGTPSRAGFVGSLASHYSAIIVALEHRFYGDSVPGGKGSDGLYNLTTANLQYLTVDNALADLAYFVDNFPMPSPPPSRAPVFWTVGGSYSGALAAWFREAYNTTTAGALASSGVVHALESFPEFDERIAQACRPGCEDQLRGALNAYEALLESDGARARSIMNMSATIDEVDALYAVADGTAMMVQYGHMVQMCDGLAPANASHEDQVMAMANLISEIWGPTFGGDCFYDTKCLSSDPARWQPTARAWRWQKCSELAYFQVAPATNSLRSTRITLAYHLAQCAAAFSIPNMKPSVDAVNAKYGGREPHETDVFYSNGSQDPWAAVAVNRTLSRSQPENTAVCDSCGHCGDLETYANSAAVDAQRASFASYIEEWLQA